jgi:hypothetical protein
MEGVHQTSVGVFVLGLLACSAPNPNSLLPGESNDPAEDAPPANGGATVDANAVFAQIAHEGYEKAPAFVQASTSYASSAVPGSLITEWVSSSAADTYAKISPTVSGSNVTMPTGATIVRVVEDATGTVSELTVLVKGPQGYNPVLGDWWFAETDPNGTPDTSADGGTMCGLLTQCYGCHTPRSADDYLFGVPSADRAPAL